jgi:hypothetical protein
MIKQPPVERIKQTHDRAVDAGPEPGPGRVGLDLADLLIVHQEQRRDLPGRGHLAQRGGHAVRVSRHACGTEFPRIGQSRQDAHVPARTLSSDVSGISLGCLNQLKDASTAGAASGPATDHEAIDLRGEGPVGQVQDVLPMLLEDACRFFGVGGVVLVPALAQEELLALGKIEEGQVIAGGVHGQHFVIAQIVERFCQSSPALTRADPRIAGRALALVLAGARQELLRFRRGAADGGPFFADKPSIASHIACRGATREQPSQPGGPGDSCLRLPKSYVA